MRRVAAIERAGPGDLTFLANPRYAPRLATTRASAVILAPGVETPLPSLVTTNPYLAYARALALLHPQERPAPGVHPSAQVDPTAKLGEGVHVGPLAVVGAGARIGARTAIHPHVVVYPEVEIGEDCLHPLRRPDPRTAAVSETASSSRTAPSSAATASASRRPTTDATRRSRSSAS